jgi:hypothetical protein
MSAQKNALFTKAQIVLLVTSRDWIGSGVGLAFSPMKASSLPYPLFLGILTFGSAVFNTLTYVSSGSMTVEIS